MDEATGWKGLRNLASVAPGSCLGVTRGSPACSLPPLPTTLSTGSGKSWHRPRTERSTSFYLSRFFLTFRIPNFTRNISTSFWIISNNRKTHIYRWYTSIKSTVKTLVRSTDTHTLPWGLPVFYRWRHQGSEMLNVFSRATELIACGVRIWTLVMKPQSLYSWTL